MKQKTTRPTARKTPGATDAPRPAEGAVSRTLFIQATQALSAVLAFDYPADAVLSRHFRDNRELGHRDRGFIAEGVYGVLRRLRWLRRLAGDEATPRMLLLTWFARGEGWPMRNFEGLVSATERDWVASIKAVEPGELTLAERADLPDWLAERLRRQMSEDELLALAHGLNRSAPLDLRVNLIKADRDAVLARLNEEGVRVEAGRFSPQAIRLAGKPALQKHPLFLDGSFEVRGRGQPAAWPAWCSRGAASWWWTSAPAPAARPCNWAR